MDLVIDANVLFSILIKKGKTEDLLFQEDLHIFAPEFLFEEFEKYRDLILVKTQRSSKEFDKLLNLLRERIKTVLNKETDKYLEQANKICPDENDVDYFALALKLNCPIWSNDKRLKKQDVVKVYSTTELFDIF